MTGFSLQGMNDKLFAQMERLEAASADELADEIERSRSMAKLANSAVASASAMLQAAKMQAGAQGQLACAVTMETEVPEALMGRRGEEAPALPEPDGGDWVAIDAFLEANAPRHSLSWLVDRLRQSGAGVDHEAVRRRCAAIGVEPVRLGGFGGIGAARGGGDAQG